MNNTITKTGWVPSVTHSSMVVWHPAKLAVVTGKNNKKTFIFLLWRDWLNNILVMYHNALTVRGTQKDLDSDEKELKHISIQQPG